MRAVVQRVAAAAVRVEGETVARIDAVTLQEVHAVAAEVLGGPFVIGAVGPFDALDLERHVA